MVDQGADHSTHSDEQSTGKIPASERQAKTERYRKRASTGTLRYEEEIQERVKIRTMRKS